MPAATIGFLLGILAVHSSAVLPPPYLFLLLLPLAWLAWRKPGVLPLLFFVLGASLSVWRAQTLLDQGLPAALEGVDLRIDGQVVDLPIQTERGWRFSFAPRRWLVAAETDTERLPTLLQLSTYAADFAPRAGEVWSLTVRLRRPHGVQNPGGFDYEAHLFARGVRAVGYVRTEPAPMRLTDGGAHTPMLTLRAALGERIRASLAPHELRQFIVAFANGDDSGIAEGQWEVLRRTGTAHLIAISGMNVGFVAGLAFLLASLAWRLSPRLCLSVPAPKAGAVAALLAATVYAALAGFSIPTQRALVMVTVLSLAALRSRRIPLVYVFSLTLLAVLLWDPFAPLSVGFWLSFLAVAFILFAVHARRANEKQWQRFLRLQAVLWFGLAPVLLYLFQQASITAPLANIVAIPIIEIVVIPATLLGAVLTWPLPGVAEILFEAAADALALLWPILTALADAPSFAAPQPPLWALFAGVAGAAWLCMPRGWPSRSLGAIGFLPLILWRPPAPGPGELWLSLVDVDQGLAAVLRTEQHALLFDAGARHSARFDLGRVAVLPYLRAAGVMQLDTLVLSHADNDHVGGAPAVRKELEPARILASPYGNASSDDVCRAGLAWVWDGVQFVVLHPGADFKGRENDTSCVLHARSRYGAVLLPADIETRAEAALVSRYGAGLAATVLVAPHHGSKSSSSQEFVRQVAPQWVLFPVGYRNRYGHPHGSVVERYRTQNAVTLDTAAHGAIEVQLTADGVHVRTWRTQRRRYWHAED